MDSEVNAWFEGGCPLDTLQVRELVKNDPFARGVTHREAEDALREGYFVQGVVNGEPIDVLVGGQPEEKLEEPDPIARWSKRFGVARHTRQARSMALAHGSALWVFGADDGRPTHEPLDFARINQLNWVKTISGGRFGGRYSASRWSLDPSSPRYEQPTHYQVSFPRGGSGEYHWTRTWQWIGVPLSDEERAELGDYGGGSILDLVWQGLKGYGISNQLALTALKMLSQGVWTNDDLARAIDGGNADQVAAHYERARLGAGPFGDYVLAGGESYAVAGRPVSGMADVMKMLRGLMVAASGQTEPIVLGAAPSMSGLNNDADAAVRAWLNKIAGRWDETFGEPLTYFYTVASRARNGPTGGIPILSLELDHPPLWDLTPAEKATIRKTNAEARNIDTGGTPTISVAEARSDKTLDAEYALEIGEALEPEAELVDDPEAEELEAEQIEEADADEMPDGEQPISLRQAAQMIGRRTPAAALSFAAAREVPVFRPNPNGQRVMFASQVREALRGSRV
jgi:hypothetical protein